MADKTTEHLKLETELLKLTAFAMLAIGGGSVGLILGEPTLLRQVFAGSGMIGAVSLFIVLLHQRRALRAYVARIKEE